MRVIPSYITLSYTRPLHMSRVPELLVDVEPPAGVEISREWVVIGRADIMKPHVGNDAVEIQLGGPRWRGDVRRSHRVRSRRATLVQIVGRRDVNHREHGITCYLAASIKKYTPREK